jgi:hypothetical protein
VLTNYHIVEDFVGELSTAQKDYAKEGFVARTQADEMKIPNVELNELISIEDVTNRVNGVVTAGMSDADALVTRRKEIGAIEPESTRATGLRSDVVTLYQGGQYNLYRYKKYTTCCVSRPNFRRRFWRRSRQLRSSASTSTWPWFAFTKTTSLFILRVISNGRRPEQRRDLCFCDW